ncbi:MAG: cyclic nucleotide-binding domain-containing protein [Gammaproteobacteria bacterium]|nr:cyclic nucleotide-binding domain-containing protein [Gammaproteobacteria bacterium]
MDPALLTSEIFNGLSPRQLKKLGKISNILELKSHETFVHENAIDKRLFVILSGEVEILKENADDHSLYSINTLGRGAVVGEMSILEDKPRSASVRTIKDTKLMEIDVENLQKHKDIYYQIAVNLGKNLALKIRTSNAHALAAIRRELDDSKAKLAVGVFIIVLITVTSLYTMLLRATFAWRSVFANTTTISLTMVLFFSISFTFFIYRSGYAWERFGFNLARWKRNTLAAVFYSFWIIALLIVLKLIAIILAFGGSHQPLFNPSSSFSKFSWKIYWITVGMYALTCPLQEFIVRGVLQSTLQQFLGDTRKDTWFAIVTSNVIFSAAHSHVEPLFILVSFTLGLFWGWLYSKQRSLLGVTVSHIIIGVFAVFVLGTF